MCIYLYSDISVEPYIDISVCVQVGNHVKKKVEYLRNPSKIDPKMVPHPLKIDLWSGLGALWAPSWRQDGPVATARPKKLKKYEILGSPVGSKMEPKSMKNPSPLRSKPS